MNYYNEHVPYVAQWLRNLIDAGHIAPGVVDERSIEDVIPSELAGFAQCHFFAGVGVWPLALRRAGWPDGKPVWTGSCPCQPFSAAGQGNGFNDERHLWPAFQHLIQERRPPVVLGEQVASKDSGPWIDLVHTDMEALGYAFGAVPFPSASVGAPHIRDRAYWVADSDSSIGRADAARRNIRDRADTRRAQGAGDAKGCGCAGIMGDPCGAGLPLRERTALVGEGRRKEGRATEQPSGASCGLANACDGAGQRGESRAVERGLQASSGEDAAVWPGPVNGFWRAADWLGCRDDKFRPVEPGTFPLVNGAPARVGRLRAYGNAINAIQAQVFIEAYLDGSVNS